VSGETEREVSGWTVDTLREYLEVRYTDLKDMLNERYTTQTKALDAAFIAQQTAMKTAFDAADKAVQAALESAEKAAALARTAAEKRFEAVNEFRGQLSDQAATFISRSEADIRITSLAEKLESETSRYRATIGELELRLTSRLDKAGGEIIGAAVRRSESRLDAGTIIQVISVLVAVAAVAIVVFHK
jgi:uncharacterized DUF497 family protein